MEAGESVLPPIRWKDLESVVASLRDRDGVEDPPIPAIFTWTGLDASDCPEAGPGVSRARSLAARARAANGDPGLDLEASVRKSPATGGFGQEITGSGTFLGFSWDVLSSGLLENQRQAVELRARARAESLRAERTTLRRRGRCRTRRVRESYAPLQEEILADRIRWLERERPYVRQAYLRGDVLLDELLRVDEELQEARRESRYLRSVSLGSRKPRLSRFPPLVQVDFDELLDRVRGDDLAERLARLERRAERAGAATDGGRRLRLFVRYEIDDDQIAGADGVSGGLRFSQPLFGGAGAGLPHRLQEARARARLEERDRVKAVEAVRRMVRERTARAVRQHYRYLTALERARRALAARRVPSASRHATKATGDGGAAQRWAALRAVASLLDAAFERTEVLANLYEGVSRAFVEAGLPFDPSLVSRIELPDVRQRGRSGRRQVYVWSRALRSFEPGLLVEISRARAIDRLSVSVHRGLDPDRLQRLGRQARESGLVVEHLFSVNRWVDPNAHQSAVRRITDRPPPEGGIHLDVEPHVLGRYEEDPEATLADYLALVRGVRDALTPGVPLTVSVPVHLPPGVYRALDEVAQRVVLMAYGTAEPREIIERLRPAVAELDSATPVVGLRVGDFNDEAEMDRAMEALDAVLGVSRFALHDLSGLVQLAGEAP